jgi:hypothetical protein
MALTAFGVIASRPEKGRNRRKTFKERIFAAGNLGNGILSSVD